jgi:hypothetical protein
MKIRAGFVSNSSSSSFLLIGNTPLTTAEEITNWLLPEKPWPSTSDNECDDDDDDDDGGYETAPNDLDTGEYLMRNSVSPVDISRVMLRLTSLHWYSARRYTGNYDDDLQRNEDASKQAQKQIAEILSDETKHLLWICSIDDHGEFGDIESGDRFPNCIHFSEH